MKPAVRSSRLFPLWLWLARRGFFKNEGLRGGGPSWWPKARVRYPVTATEPGGLSVAMPIGNAVDYAEIGRGEVVPPTCTE